MLLQSRVLVLEALGERDCAPVAAYSAIMRFAFSRFLPSLLFLITTTPLSGLALVPPPPPLCFFRGVDVAWAFPDVPAVVPLGMSHPALASKPYFWYTPYM